MRGHGRTSLVLVVLSAVMAGTVIAALSVPAQDDPARGQQQKFDEVEFESQFPVTDVNKPEPADPEKRAKWQAKSKKYAGVGLRITERAELVTVTLELGIGPAALPVSLSDAVVIGEVTDAQAYLSSEKDWVYSEFTIRVDEVLKNTLGVALTEGSSLIADREGGRVRFPSGRTTLLNIPGQGMPRVGRRYALFLTHPDQEQGAHILTGYELRGGRVFPIDDLGGQRHPIAKYKGADETSFLSDLRAAVANAQ